jgi:hypothetical protein
MRIILVASGGKERTDGGGVFLEQLVGGLVNHQLMLVELKIGSDLGVQFHPGDPARLQIGLRGPVPGLGWLQQLNRRIAGWVEWNGIRPLQLRSRLTMALPYLSEFGADLILGIITSMESISALGRFADALERPLVTMEWDPPESMAHSLKLPGVQLRRALGEYQRVLRRAAASAVTSEGMEERYRRQFGRSSVILRQYVEPPRQTLNGSRRDRSEWLLYVGGSIYATREFETFLAALDLCGWILHDRAVRLRWLGSGATLKASGPRSIEFLGWRPFQESLEFASDCDLGYVPYWFDPGHALETECCFPSKMISYLGVGLPPFFHGPGNAGPALFLRKFNTGYVCTEQTPEAVLRDLRAALADPSEHALRRTRCREVAATQFSQQTFSTGLQKLLDEGCGKPPAAAAEACRQLLGFAETAALAQPASTAARRFTNQ